MNKVIRDFGSEWEKFNYLSHTQSDFIRAQFQRYLKPVPEHLLSKNSTVAADLGAGSGRWTRELAHYVKLVHAVEPSEKAFRILKSGLGNNKKIILHNSSIEELSLEKESLDFAMSLGVLHHIESTQDALIKIFSLIKPGGIFLGYLYYNFENKPFFYKVVWKLSDFLRIAISRLPTRSKVALAEVIAILMYLPLARLSLAIMKLGVPVENLPLHQYAEESLYVMRNDALDRFGTRLEKRFSRSEITQMLLEAGADPDSINFSPEEPFWSFSAIKR